MTARKTKVEKLLNLLSDGKNYRPETIARRTGLANVSAAVNSLREEGVKIYTNTRGRKGEKYRTYRMA